MTTGVGEDDTDLLNVPQVAKMLGVSKVTVWRLVGRHELESLKVGRSRRIMPQAVDDYKDRRREPAAPSAGQAESSAA